MEIHEEKDKIQREAVIALSENNGGMVALPTGAGKARVAIEFIKLKELVLGKKLKILICVPTTKLRDNTWKDEFEKWSQNGLYERIERSCYVSINKIKNEKYDIVILDECQHLTLSNSKFFDDNTMDTIVGLSATLPKESEKVEILRKLRLKTVYEMSVDEAVEKGIVSPFKLTFIGLPLNNTSKYIKAGNKKTSWLTTEAKQYEYLTNRIEHMQKTGERHESIKFARLTRMRFIYNLKSKVNVARYVLKNIIPEDEKTLIFAGSIDVAEKLEPNSFHSKSNDVAYNKFMNDEIKRLSSVKSLKEGVNIPNLDNALIVQVMSKERHLIQSLGRVIRYRPDHIAKIYIVYVKGTIDEQWVKSAVENIDISNAKYLKFKV